MGGLTEPAAGVDEPHDEHSPPPSRSSAAPQRSPARAERGLAIETQGLRKTYGRNVAVADLSLSIGRGEVFGFLGPNGAGKTTSLKLLLGLAEPSGGRGCVLGAPLGERNVRAKIGFLPEHFRFHDCLTGRELLDVHGRLHGLRGAALARRIDALLERVDLVDAADRPLRTYSKGMIQRAGLAQALINAPDLVFLDEPTSGLDPLGRRLVRDVIDSLRRKGTTVFLNSHLLGEVETTCDRVAFVKRGRVVHELSLTGASAEHGFEVELRVAPSARAQDAPVNRTGGACQDAVRDALAGLGTLVDDSGGRARLRVAGEHVLPEIARRLVAAGLDLYEMRYRRKSLEEWFLEVMGEDQRPG